MNDIVVYDKELDALPPVDLEAFRSGAVVRSFGGGLEGASSLSRETALWQPSFLNPDGVINLVKDVADARGRDSVQNDGYALGAVSVHRDSVIGAQYRLNARPVWQAIPDATEGYADELQQVAEMRWQLSAESNACWLDAGRVNTFTGMARLAIAVFFMTGEVTATAEWIRQSARPFNTAIRHVLAESPLQPEWRFRHAIPSPRRDERPMGRADCLFGSERRPVGALPKQQLDMDNFCAANPMGTHANDSYP